MNVSILEAKAKVPLASIVLSGHIEAPGLKRSIREINRRQRWRRLKAGFLRIFC